MQRASSALLQQVDMEETKPAPSRLRRAATSPAAGPRSAVLARREHDVDQLSVSPQQRVSFRAAADVDRAMVPQKQPCHFALQHGLLQAQAQVHCFQICPGRHLPFAVPLVVHACQHC